VVQLAAIRLSEGELHRLAHWLDEAERNPGTFRWYAGEPTDVSTESHRFAIEFINALTDRNVPRSPPGPQYAACQIVQGASTP
jgi:hypothetical protein